MARNPREDVATRPQTVDPVLLAASRLRGVEARRRLAVGAWSTLRIVGVGFLLGAIAVHAIASVRMARRIESLTLRVGQLERERGAASGSGDCGLVFPALDIPTDGARSAPPMSAALSKE